MSQHSQSDAGDLEDSERAADPVYCGILKKWVLRPAKECLSSQTDELVREGKQAMRKSSLLPWPLWGLPPAGETEI